MIIAVEENDLLAVCRSAGGHHGKARHIVAVLCKKRPISGSDRINQQLREINHDRRGDRHAVFFFKLCERRLIDILITVAQHVRAVTAHVVDIIVTVLIPEMRTFRMGGIQRESVIGDIAALGRALMAINARRDDFQRAVKSSAAFFISIYFKAHSCHLLSYAK